MYYSNSGNRYDAWEPITPPALQLPPPKKQRVWHKVLALCLVCTLLGGAAGIGGALLMGASGYLPDNTVLRQGERVPVAIDISKVNTGTQLEFTEIYAANVNSVVGVTVDVVTTNYFGQTVTHAAAGSGFVITEDGYILTNYHVVEGANSITISFYNGDSYKAELIGGEQENDIAVLKIEATGLAPVIIGDSEQMRVGESVAAIGNPLGELTFTLTGGYVSALDRTITMSDGSAMNMLQTDVSINEGNSGGPLFNSYGEVVGITTAKYSSRSTSGPSIEGIGFAIPINDVIDMVRDIMEHGYVTGKPYMGVSVTTALESEAARYGRRGGAQLVVVESGYAAARAGLQVGDIITQMGDDAIDSSAALIRAKDRYKAGDAVEITFDREGKIMTTTLTFDEAKPVTNQPAQQQQSGAQNVFPWAFSGNGN